MGHVRPHRIEARDAILLEDDVPDAPRKMVSRPNGDRQKKAVLTWKVDDAADVAYLSMSSCFHAQKQQQKKKRHCHVLRPKRRFSSRPPQARC